MGYDGMQLCAVPDHLGGMDCLWPFVDVTVHAEGLLGQINIREAVEQAVAYWNAVCGLKLTTVANAATAHIVVGTGHIDGPQGTLAWSELPCGFTVGQWRKIKQQYDTGEMWVIGENPPGNKIDAVRVICHELGHAIGISHINDGNLMAPTYSSAIRKPQRGDIAEARARYGLPGPVPTPTPVPVPTPTPVPGTWVHDPDFAVFRRV